MKFTKETLYRTIRTFMQAFLAYAVITIPDIDFTAGQEVVKQGLVALGVGGVAAGIAALMNLEEGAEEYNG